MNRFGDLRDRATRTTKRWLRRGGTRLVVSLRPMAPPAAWETILTARSLVGSGPIVLAPIAFRALAIAPHPDDEVLGCGGSLSLLAQRGCVVHVLCVTSGEASVAALGSPSAVTASVRRDEAVAACRVLGIDGPQFLDFPDGHVDEHVDELAQRLEAELIRFEPEIVLLPWVLDGHPDHSAIAAALAQVALPPAAEIWTYEVWSPLPANRIVDITSVWEEKEAALACHASGDEGFDLRAHLSLNRWRSIFGLDGRGYAEAFSVLDPSEFYKLAESHRS
jgi:LmbE family N-acetylglucosaminyl deacetylase